MASASLKAFATSLVSMSTVYNSIASIGPVAAMASSSACLAASIALESEGKSQLLWQVEKGHHAPDQWPEVGDTLVLLEFLNDKPTVGYQYKSPRMIRSSDRSRKLS